MIPQAVLDAYAFQGPHKSASSGLINSTYILERDQVVVQKLHPVFGPTVNFDLDAVTTRLAEQGLETPRLVRTQAGEAFVENDGQYWRAISYIDGICIDRVERPAQASGAGRAAARYHQALAGWEYEYQHVRSGVHDTAAHLQALQERSGTGADERDALAADILRSASALPALPELPLEHCHGDLKISNILFAPDDETRSLCLIDLDTTGRMALSYELGDALRSWCNPVGEDTETPSIDGELVLRALRGYVEVRSLSRQETQGVILGLETVCLELAARFAVDTYDDSYFGWDRARFASRRDHNLMRARGQLALSRSVTQRRDELLALAYELTERPDED